MTSYFIRFILFQQKKYAYESQRRKIMETMYQVGCRLTGKIYKTFYCYDSAIEYFNTFSEEDNVCIYVG